MMKNIYRNLSKILSVLSFISVGFIIYKTIEINRLDKKFKSTKLDSTMSEIKTNWGIPDSEFNYEGNRLVKYSDCIGWGNYIFVIEKNQNKLIGKYFDD